MGTPTPGAVGVCFMVWVTVMVTGAVQESSGAAPYWAVATAARVAAMTRKRMVRDSWVVIV